MPTLRLLPSGPGPNDQAGEILAIAYTPDGAYVLSGGWDGYLRLWESAYGAHVTAVQAGDKPVCACSITADGKHWLSGNMQGMLAHWDSVNHRQVSVFLAHTRPVSSIQLSVDARNVATSGYDGKVTIWTLGREREARVLSGHRDIVAGCRYTPDGKGLVSWSYDGTVKWWDPSGMMSPVDLGKHPDRVTAGCVSPDSRWLATGSRDGSIKLWDLQVRSEAVSLKVPEEVRACLFLLDGETLVVLDAQGRLTTHAVPSMEEQSELFTDLPAQCAELAPAGNQIALGCGDGRVRFLSIEGLDSKPLIVTATQTSRRTQTTLQRLLGKSRLTNFFHCICPACRQTVPLNSGTSGQSAKCPNCKQPLRISSIARVIKEK